MSEIIVKYDEPIAAASGATYFAQVAGKEVAAGMWEGWLEFLPVNETWEALASGRETTQPNRTNLEYWAQGLTKVYLEGALVRAIALTEPGPEQSRTDPEEGLFSSPARRQSPERTGSRVSESPYPILDPFAVYSQGEEVLCSELNALSRDHVESIVRAYGFSTRGSPSDMQSLTRGALVEAIVDGVRGAKGRGSTDFEASEHRL